MIKLRGFSLILVRVEHKGVVLQLVSYRKKMLQWH